jgi:hypothetical protein
MLYKGATASSRQEGNLGSRRHCLVCDAPLADTVRQGGKPVCPGAGWRAPPLAWCRSSRRHNRGVDWTACPATRITGVFVSCAILAIQIEHTLVQPSSSAVWKRRFEVFVRLRCLCESQVYCCHRSPRETNTRSMNYV